MKPKPTIRTPQRELFRVELVSLVDLAHPLVKLGEKINWQVFDEQLGQTFDGKTGAPGINTRLMVALHYLKYQYNLSDEAVVARWVENPYWQHFSGHQFFEHELPIDPSSMTRWRKRLGEAGAETMLKATIEAGADQSCKCRYYRPNQSHPLPDGLTPVRPSAGALGRAR
jgi:IS5 family transposase